MPASICYTAVSLKPRFGYDDALDVVGVHMVGGTLGALLTGVFATKDVNSAIPTLTLGLDGGLLYGYPGLMVKQLIAVVATYVFCGVGSFLLLDDHQCDHAAPRANRRRAHGSRSLAA